MKHYLNSIVLLFLTFVLPAQRVDRLCLAPSVTSKVVIQYENYAKTYLEFDTDNFTLSLRMPDGASAREYTVRNGQLVIPDMALRARFELAAKNDCGDEVVLDALYTSPTDVKKDGVAVSKRMFEAIADWQRLPERPRLYDYLKANSDLPAYEKIAFIQAFYFGGQPFRVDMQETLPEIPPLLTCNCILVLNHNQFLVPGTQQNGFTMPEVEDSNGEIDWNDQSGYFYHRSTAGAAKWHFIRTQGWKAGGTSRHYGYSVADSTYSPHHGELALSYVCEDGQEPGRECECVKQVKLSSRYDTDVSAMAEVLGGISIGDRDSWALTEDMAVVTLRYGDSPDIEVLDAGHIRLEAECDAGVNTQFFVNYYTVAAQVAIAILQGETTGVVDPNLIAGIANSMGELISTPIYNHASCSDVEQEETLVLNNATVELAANQRVYYDLFSFTNQHAGGKRSWASESNINSSFFMTATVPGGAGEQPRECCTNTLATWVFADEGGPLSDGTLAKLVGGELNLSGGSPTAPWRYLGITNLPVDPGTGAVKIPAEYGWADIVIDCEGLSEPGNPGQSASLSVIPGHRGVKTQTTPTAQLDARAAADRSMPETEVLDAFTEHPANIFVFDIAGRLLYTGQGMIDRSRIRDFFRDNNLAQTPGIYFVHLVQGKHRETVKVAVVK